MGEDAGIAGALINLVGNIRDPLLGLLAILCYVLALCAFLQGVMRVHQHSEDKYHAPSGLGTVLSFVICVVLVSLPAWMNAAGESLFGDGAAGGAAALGYGGGSAARFNELLGALFALVALVGLLAFIRGTFVLRAAADGRPGASAGRAFAHLIGGVAAWHMVALIDALQTTLGIQVLEIQ